MQARRNHYYKYHNNLAFEKHNHAFEQLQTGSDDDEHNGVLLEEQPANTAVSLEQLSRNLQKHIALFVLRIQEKHVLPKVVQQTVVDDVKFI